MKTRKHCFMTIHNHHIYTTTPSLVRQICQTSNDMDMTWILFLKIPNYIITECDAGLSNMLFSPIAESLQAFDSWQNLADTTAAITGAMWWPIIGCRYSHFKFV